MMVENDLYKNYHPLEQIKILRFHAFLAFFLAPALHLLSFFFFYKTFYSSAQYFVPKEKDLFMTCRSICEIIIIQ